MGKQTSRSYEDQFYNMDDYDDELYTDEDESEESSAFKSASAKGNKKNGYNVKKKIEMQLERRRLRKNLESIYDDWD